MHHDIAMNGEVIVDQCIISRFISDGIIPSTERRIIWKKIVCVCLCHGQRLKKHLLDKKWILIEITYFHQPYSTGPILDPMSHRYVVLTPTIDQSDFLTVYLRPITYFWPSGFDHYVCSLDWREGHRKKNASVRVKVKCQKKTSPEMGSKVKK